PVEPVERGDIAETAVAGGDDDHLALGPELRPARTLALLLVAGAVGGDDPFDHLAILHAMDDSIDLRALAQALLEHAVIIAVDDSVVHALDPGAGIFLPGLCADSKGQQRHAGQACRHHSSGLLPHPPT